MRKWKITINQGMGALSAPHVIHLCAHCHENHFTSRGDGCKAVAGHKETGDRSQNDRSYGT